MTQSLFSNRLESGWFPTELQSISLPIEVLPLLAVGGELKNAFVLAQDRCAFLSRVIGDLQDYETLQAFEKTIEKAEQSLGIHPEIIAYDLHPNYLATRYALDRAGRDQVQAMGVQHHHAHVAACMADNAHPGDRPVIGISFDGTGYGEDGAIWGGEFLLADYNSSYRYAHLGYAPLPGGDVTVRQPWRMALAWLHAAGIEWASDLPSVQCSLRSKQYSVTPSSSPLDILKHQLTHRVNTPLTSSMGRLFDAVSALIGICPVIEYEAQAAIALEKIVDPGETAFYPFEITPSAENAPRQLDLALMFRELLTDLRNGIPLPILSARFHNTVAWMVVAVCEAMHREYGLSEVALSGGVWQNKTLLLKTLPLLQKGGFKVLLHRQAPPSDAGLALGQAAIAGYRAKGA